MHPPPPSTARAYPFLDHDGPLAFAHRGGAAYARNVGLENSMAAFQTAVDLGYRYLETDVQVTADREVVVFHDASLRRLTGRPGRVADVAYADLSRARVGGREAIPRLSDLLDTWPDVRVNIDVKVGGAVEPLARVLRRRPGDLERVCVASFSEPRIRRVRRLLGRGWPRGTVRSAWRCCGRSRWRGCAACCSRRRCRACRSPGGCAASSW